MWYRFSTRWRQHSLTCGSAQILNDGVSGSVGQILGTRGSLPAPLNESAIRTKIRQALIIARGRQFASVDDIDAFIDKELPFSVRGTFGGNSSCVEIATRSEDYFLCDLGTGLREFSGCVMADHKSASRSRFNIFLSHLHWDHIQGFPFFAPAHTPGAVIRIYGCHGSMRKALRNEQSAPYFPVKFEELKASIDFIELQPGRTYDISGISVTPMLQCHAGDLYGYRFAYDGKTVVYFTDNEHSLEAPSETARLVEFYRDADLLIRTQCTHWRMRSRRKRAGATQAIWSQWSLPICHR